MEVMKSFLNEIKEFEIDKRDTYDIKIGQIPVILTSAHGIEQQKRGGRIKFAEPMTRGIAKYVNKKTGCFYLVKNEDTGVDPNKRNDDEFKNILLQIIEKNHIKLLIDLHGAKKERDFDVELGTLNGKMADEKTVGVLVDCLQKNGVTKIAFNEPFKGGFITRTVFNNTGINCIQLEINGNYRNIRKANNLKKICKALTDFIDMIN